MEKKSHNYQCPLCRENYDPNYSGKDLLAQNMLNDANVTCIYKGCPWKSKLVNLNNHIQKCLFNTTKLGQQVYENSALKVGTSIIDLSNCISTLKQIYGYGENEVLYIGVLDVIRDDTSAPQFEYTIHNHLGTKLDINYCINNELTIQKSLNQSNNISLAKDILSNYGYDIIDYNKDNKFFCDICSIFDYDRLDAYDVLLNDRYKYYYENQQYYFCEDTCDGNAVKTYLNNSRVVCVCKGKGNFTTYRKVLNDGNSFKRAFAYSLLESFVLKNQIRNFEYIIYDINNLLKKKYR